MKGDTRAARLASSDQLWKWIDARGKDFGIGRPYLARDPPHVGPTDGAEYVSRRGGSNTKEATVKTKKRQRTAARNSRSAAKHASRRTAKSEKTAQSSKAAHRSVKETKAAHRSAKDSKAAAHRPHSATKRARTARS